MPKRRSDGSIEKTVTDPRTGKRLHFYGHTTSEVNRKILEWTEASSKGRTFREVAEEWHDEHWPTLAPNTLRGYNPAYKRALDEFGSEYVSQIKPRDIKKFITDFSKGDRSRKVVVTQLGILSMVFSHAVEEGDIDFSPCDHISPPKNLKKTHREAASKEDEERIKASASIWLFPTLVLYTGLRKGEALALTYDDIDRDEKVIHVTKSVYHENNKPAIKRPKTEAGTRTVPILKPLEGLLPKRGKGYLFSEDGGKTPLTEMQYQRRWREYAKETGITCTAHQLRHSFATMLFECGIEVKDAQDLLGHSTAAMTQDIYTHLRNSRRQTTAEKLNAALSGPSEKASHKEAS